MTLNCKNCIHHAVCKYKEKYASFVNALENIIIKEPIPGGNGKDQQYIHNSVKEYEIFIDLRPACKFYRIKDSY